MSKLHKTFSLSYNGSTLIVGGKTPMVYFNSKYIPFIDILTQQQKIEYYYGLPCHIILEEF